MKLKVQLGNLLARAIRGIFSGGAKLIGQKKAVLIIDFPPNATPRYGTTHPPISELTELMASNREMYRSILKDFTEYSEKLSAIGSTPPNDIKQPYWKNGFVGGLNALALYCFIASRRPNQYVEVGSGNSTKFARRAILDNNLPTKISSIDPEPRAEVDELCDKVYRYPLENVDQQVFSLSSGDIVFFDGSH